MIGNMASAKSFPQLQGAPYVAAASKAVRAWVAPAAPPLFLVILCLVFFHHVLLGPYVFPWDFTSYMYPVQRFVGDSIHSGEFPLWDPYVQLGYPVIGDPQAAIFNPLYLLYHLTPGLPALSVRAFEAMEILWIAAAGVFAYCLGRQVGLQPIGSFFAGLVYMLAGFLPIHVEHETQAVTAAWIPLLLLVAMRLFDRGKLHYLMALSLVLALSVFSGHPQTTLLSVYLLLFWLAWQHVGQLWHGRFNLALKPLLTMSGALLLAVCLSAVQLLPSADLTLQTSRGAMQFSSFRGGGLSPGAPITLLFPKVFGSDGSFPYRGGEVTYAQIYLGLVPLIFTLMGLLTAFRRRAPCAHNRHAPFFLALTVVAFVGSLGTPFYLYRALQLLPFMVSFRRPGALLPFAVLGVAMISGMVTDGLARSTSSVKGRVGIVGASLARMRASDPAGLAFALAAILAAVYVAGSLQPRLVQEVLSLFRGNVPLQIIATPRLAPALQRVCLGMLPVSLALVGLLAAMRRAPGARPVLVIALAGLTIADLFTFNSGQIFNASENNPIDVARKLPGIHRIRAESLGRYRIAQEWYLHLFNAGNVLQVEDMSGYNPLTVRRVNEFLSAIPSVNSRLFDVTNVRYLLVTKRYVEAHGPPETFAQEISKRVSMYIDIPAESLDPHEFSFEGSTYYGWYQLWENRNVLPRFYGVSHYFVIPDSSQRLAALSASSFDPSQVVVLQQPLEGSLGGRIDGAVNVVSYRNNSFEITARAVGGGALLFMSVPYYPGWQATVDGEPTHIYVADHAFMAVHLERGAHTIRMVFEPVAFTLGVWITGLSLALCLSLATISILVGVNQTPAKPNRMEAVIVKEERAKNYVS